MAELTPGDNNNEKEQENENVIEASDQDQQPEPTPNLEPAEAAVMVGLDKDNFGAAAPTSDEINAAQNAQNQQSGPSAQDLANHQQNEDSIFTASPHSNDAAMAQINLGLQGIEGQVDGVIGATLQQNQIEEEKAKKERERIMAELERLGIEFDASEFDAIDQANETFEVKGTGGRGDTYLCDGEVRPKTV